MATHMGPHESVNYIFDKLSAVTNFQIMVQGFYQPERFEGRSIEIGEPNTTEIRIKTFGYGPTGFKTGEFWMEVDEISIPITDLDWFVETFARASGGASWEYDHTCRTLVGKYHDRGNKPR